MSDSVVRLSRVSKRYPNGTEALAAIDMETRRGEFLCLLGPSGCGKSTILRLIAGLASPSEGHVEVDHAGAPGTLGFVFQESTLMPWARVVDNVRLPLRLARVPRAEAVERAEAALEAVGLAGFARAYPRELSGGMRMRVSIARALVTSPTLLLMDEPFAALDEITRQKLNDDLIALWRKTGLTVIFVTHSVLESAYLATRILVMSARPGRISRELVLAGPGEDRDPDWRVSARYAETTAEVSAALAEASAR